MSNRYELNLPPEMDRAIERCAAAFDAAYRLCGDEMVRTVDENEPAMRRWRAALMKLTRAAKRSGRVCADTRVSQFNETHHRARTPEYVAQLVQRKRAKMEAKAEPKGYRPAEPRHEWAKRAGGNYKLKFGESRARKTGS